MVNLNLLKSYLIRSKLLNLAKTAEAKQRFAKSRVEYENLAAAVMKAKAPPAKIDWAAYSKAIQAPGLADKLKAEYDSISYNVAVPALDTSVFDQTLSEAKAIADEARVEVTKLEEELAFFEVNRVTHETTLEEYWSWHPGMKEQILQEIEDVEYYKNDPDLK